MNREDAIKLLAVIKVAYPYSYKGMDDSSIEATVNMWHTSFSDVPYMLMQAAFNSFRFKSKFPPTVADMCEELQCIYWSAVEIYHDPRITQELANKSRAVMECTHRFKSEVKTQLDFNEIPSNLLPQQEYKRIGEGWCYGI